MVYLNRIKNKLRQLYIVKLGPLIRAFRTPPIPRNPGGVVLVHIGCGELNDHRFINVEARAMPHVHYVSQRIDIPQFMSDSIDLIYACHVLEHVPYPDVPHVLARWHHCLKPGGILRLSVPDFDRILEIYHDQLNNIESILPPLMGGQDYEFNRHKAVFNNDYLRAVLSLCGFSIVRAWEPSAAPFHDFDDWSGRHYVLGLKEYPISLNIEAVK